MRKFWDGCSNFVDFSVARAFPSRSFSCLVLPGDVISRRLLYLFSEEARVISLACEIRIVYFPIPRAILVKFLYSSSHPLSLSFGAINLKKCPVGQVLLNLGRTDRLRMEEQLEVETVVYNYLRVKVRHFSYALLNLEVAIGAVRCIWEKGEAVRVRTRGGGLRE